jgi:5S rRNA maturation endonuclease (ribonuclease M5)
MQEAELRAALIQIGAGDPRPAGPRHIKFSCILAPWTHGRGSDRRPSMTATVGPGVSLLKCHACKHLGSLADTVLKMNTLAGGLYSALGLQLKAREHELALEDLDFTDIDGRDRYARQDPDRDYTQYLVDLVQAGLSDRAKMLFVEKGVDPDFAASQFYCATVPGGYSDPGMGTDRYGNPKRTKGECLVFPVLVSGLDAGNVRCIGAQVRPLVPDPLKYWTIWPFVSGRHLFGEHFLSHVKGRPLSVVEGPFDAMHLTQLGAWAVGINGVNFSEEKARLIRAADPSVVGVLLDPDDAGQNAAENVNRMLTKCGVPCTMHYLSQDPKYLTQQDLATNYQTLLP